MSATEKASAYCAVIPTVRGIARLRFRFLACIDTREDRIEECIAVGWKWHLGLWSRGKDVREFPVVFAQRVSLSVACGRRCACADPVAETMGDREPQRSMRFNLELGAHSHSTDDMLADWLIDNTVSSIPDQVAFRLDFPQWVRSLQLREVELIGSLLREESGLAIAGRMGVSPTRVCQLRRELAASWRTWSEGTAD